MVAKRKLTIETLSAQRAATQPRRREAWWTSGVSLPSASRRCDRKDSTSQYGRRLLHCGISIQPMTAWGH